MTPAEPAPLLQIEDLHKSFGSHHVLRGVDLAVPRGSIFSVLGPSGAGKSVFLKCVAHVEQPDAGRIRFDQQAIGSADASAHARFLRRCSFLFQSNALFDSLTALENVALPLEQTTRLTDREIRERSLEALRQLDLDGHGSRYPSQLSGGMQKRLALARAIVTQPDLVLFDEPTAGLDPIRRNNVFAMIAHNRHKFHFTALIVTHDVPEALVASDRVALLDRGSICFEGTPAEFSGSSHPVVCGFRDNTEALRNSLAAIRHEARPS